jgi:serine phosphatase RsbU (regulator of sigma subunit)
VTETAEKATMQKELEVARAIQETLLPPTGVIKRPPLTIFGYFRSATVCGGDFWNVADLEDGRTLVAIGDVTGHGAPSAMITATAKSSMDTVRSVRGEKLALTYMLEEMNKTIFSSAKRKFVMTLFAMAFDRSRNLLTFANAGHNFPFLLRREEGEIRVSSLVARGNRLGDVEESRYMEHKLEVQSGDLIALYTDGLTEFRNDSGQEYSERRFRRMLESTLGQSAGDVGKAVLRDLADFAGRTPQEDDITLVIVEVGHLGGPPPIPTTKRAKPK